VHSSAHRKLRQEDPEFKVSLNSNLDQIPLPKGNHVVTVQLTSLWPKCNHVITLGKNPVGVHYVKVGVSTGLGSGQCWKTLSELGLLLAWSGWLPGTLLRK
jgi:hypothetical protein